MILTDPDEIALAKIQLAEARSVRHKLMLGQNVASYKDQNGEEVTYSKGNLSGLLAYIAELEESLGIVRPRVSAPMRAIFG